MKIKLLIIGFAFSLFSTFANAEMAKAGYTEVVGAEEQLEVIYVDHEKRWVRLKDENGYARKIDVPEDVQNFDQVAVGDTVTISYAESIEVRAYAPGMNDEENMIEAAFGEAETGQKPGKVYGERVVMVATIEAIDLANNTVTLKDADGNTEVFPARYPENLKKVDVGDKVVITHTEAAAINVTGKASDE